MGALEPGIKSILQDVRRSRWHRLGAVPWDTVFGLHPNVVLAGLNRPGVDGEA